MRRVFLLGSAIILLCFQPALGQGSGVCGDADGSGNLDIADFVYLINYMFAHGPAPASMTDANADLCDEVDIADIAFLLRWVFRGGPDPCPPDPQCDLIPGGQIWLSGVDGAIGASTVQTGVPITFHVSFHNNTLEPILASANGFRVYSDDGAQWGTTSVCTTYTLTGDHWYFNYWAENYGAPSGQGADTLGYGAIDHQDWAMEPGFNESVLAITIGPIDASYDGHTICLDSSFFEPAGVWKWCGVQDVTFEPSWEGPYCFDIIAPVETRVMLEPDFSSQSGWEIPTGRELTWNLRYTNNSPDTVWSIMNGLRVYTTDGAEWATTVADSTGVLGGDNFNVAFAISYFSVTGSGADSVNFGGAAIPLGSYTGLWPGFDDIPFTLTIGPIDSVHAGKTICIDSSWTPPSGNWYWSATHRMYYPAWYGPYCYTVYYEEIPPVTLVVAPDTLTFATWEYGPNPSPQAFSVAEIIGRPLAWTAESDAGSLSWLTTPVLSGDAPGEIPVEVNSSGMSTGDYYGHITVTSPEAENPPVEVVVKLAIEPAPEAAVLLDHVDGVWGGDQVTAEVPVTFWMRMINNTGYDLTGLANGYKVYSPDGAEWTSALGTFTEALDPIVFDVGRFINYYGVTGSGADTVGFAAAATEDGMVNGFDDIVYSIQIGPIDSAHVDKTICLDSAFFPPSGVWKWDGPGVDEYFAYWLGPYCYTVTVSGGPGVDSLILPSVTVQTGNMVQPVQMKLTQPVKGGTIPLEIPSGAAICSLSTAGLVTEGWDYNYLQVRPDSGFLLIALANSYGETVPEGTHTVGNIHFRAINADCNLSTFVHWDTTLMNDPVRQLLFADTNGMDIQPGFDPARDVTEIPPYMPGDIDASGGIDIADLVFLVDYMFTGGSAPDIMDAADVNGSCSGPNIADLVYFVDYNFQNGDAPVCGCLGQGGGAAKLSPEITVATVRENNQTVIVINSPTSLRGVELVLSGSGDAAVEGLVDNLDLLSGYQDGRLRVGLIDLDGSQTIAAGSQRLVRINGTVDITSATVAADGEHAWAARIDNGTMPGNVPSSFVLRQNYPNPFNPTTEISFGLPTEAQVTIDIYNIVGQKVTTLVDGSLAAGNHTVVWDGSRVASGVYFYRLSTDTFAETRKMMLLK